MRRLISLFTLVLSLTACTGGNSLDSRIIEDDSGKQIVEENKPLEGIIIAQEYKLNMYGTHSLEDEMGAFIVYLQSKTISLNNYVGSKVSLEGTINKTYDGKTILEVNKIIVLQEGVVANTTSEEIYVSQNLGFNLTFPTAWKYEEGDNSLSILPDGTNTLIQIEKIENERDKELYKFVDEDDQTELTVNEFEAIRTIIDDTINVYINTANQNVYKVVFTPIEKTSTEKSSFYSILKSFASNEKKEKVKVCGGVGKVKCASGYRCEVSSDEEDAVGVCMKIDAEEEIDPEILAMVEKDVELQIEAQEQAIAEAAAEIEPEKIEIVAVNENIDSITEAEFEQGYYYAQKDQKKPGTPSFWIHSGEGSDANWHLPAVGSDIDEELKKNSKFQLIDYFNLNKKELLHEKNLVDFEVQGYEFSTNQIVFVILKTEEKNFKIQYQYNLIDEFEVELIEIAYFEEGEEGDWEKVSSVDL